MIPQKECTQTDAYTETQNILLPLYSTVPGPTLLRMSNPYNISVAKSPKVFRSYINLQFKWIPKLSSLPKDYE